MVLRFPETTGTSGDDVINGSLGGVHFGLAGNDSFIGSSGEDLQIFVGGSGADTYIVSNNSAIVVADFIASEGDLVVASGIGFSKDTSFSATVDGQHFLGGDIDTGQFILAIDFMDPANRIETIQLADGVFGFDQLVDLFLSAPNFLGNFAWESLSELGIEGFPTAEINEAIGFYAERAAELESTLPLGPDLALFDEEFYLLENPDVAGAGLDPQVHYDQFGWREGRDPSALFDTDFYLQNNPDIVAADVNPLDHFEFSGVLEGRNPNPLFDTDFYLRSNPDIAESGLNPLTHYSEFGWTEGRNPSAAFDGDAYLAAYSDVSDADLDPLAHYLQFGINEGREIFPVDAVA